MAMETVKKMNEGEYQEEKECTCPQCGYRGPMDDFEADEIAGAVEGAGLKSKRGPSKIREAMSKAMLESGAEAQSPTGEMGR